MLQTPTAKILHTPHRHDPVNEHVGRDRTGVGPRDFHTAHGPQKLETEIFDGDLCRTGAQRSVQRRLYRIDRFRRGGELSVDPRREPCHHTRARRRHLSDRTLQPRVHTIAGQTERRYRYTTNTRIRPLTTITSVP